MEEKKYVKISFGTAICLAFLFILIVCGLVFGVYYHTNNNAENESLSSVNDNVNGSEENNIIIDEDRKENTEEEEKTNEISKLGEYTTKEIEVTPDEETYGIHDITLERDNEFSINMPLGTSYKGTYKIEDNNLICNAVLEEIIEGGGLATTDVNIEFVFEILDESKLKFKKVSDKSFELTLGMTYAIERDVNITNSNSTTEVTNNGNENEVIDNSIKEEDNNEIANNENNTQIIDNKSWCGKYVNKSQTEYYYHEASIAFTNQTSDTIDFVMSALHGSNEENVNIGEVEGTAKIVKLNEKDDEIRDIYIFEDNIDGKVYKIKFIFNAYRRFEYVEVEQDFPNDINPYAGNNVYFDGVYEKVSSM